MCDLRNFLDDSAVSLTVNTESQNIVESAAWVLLSLHREDTRTISQRPYCHRSRTRHERVPNDNLFIALIVSLIELNQR